MIPKPFHMKDLQHPLCVLINATHTHTYTSYTKQAESLLSAEVELVREGMGHKELTVEEYSRVWEECYKEVRMSVGCALIWVLGLLSVGLLCLALPSTWST